MMEMRGMGEMMGGRMCRMMDTFPEGQVDPKTLPEPDAPGAKVLKIQCVQCHGLVSPGRHSAEDWPVIVERMDRRMRMMSGQGMMRMMRSFRPISEKEKADLLEYLKRHSFASVEPGKLSTSDPGTQAFARICSQCHALPDPRTHTGGDWPAVVDRMAQNMKKMGVGTLSVEEREKLLSFLTSPGTPNRNEK